MGKERRWKSYLHIYPVIAKGIRKMCEIARFSCLSAQVLCLQFILLAVLDKIPASVEKLNVSL